MGPDTRLLAIASDHHGLVTVAEARRVGLSSKQIRGRVARGTLQRTSPRVLRVAGSPRTSEQRLLEAVWSSGPQAVASHGSAAWLHRLDGAIPPDPAEVLVPRPVRGNRTVAMVHETGRLDAADRTLVTAIPTTTVTRTLVDLAGTLPLGRLEQMLDAALRDRLTTPARLRWRLEVLGTDGRSGCRRLLDLLDADHPKSAGCESWLESQFLRLFARTALPTPEVQRIVRDRSGRTLRADFAFLEGRLIVEVSGHATHSTRRQRQADAERRAELALLGVTHLEFTYEDLIERPGYLIDRVTQILVALAGSQVPAQNALKGHCLPGP